MMSKFKGRSEHTVRIPSKPVSEGYEVLALCDAGYTLNWLFTSRIESVPELRRDDNLTPTGSACAQLLQCFNSNKAPASHSLYG